MLSVLFGLIAVAEAVLLGLVITLRRRWPDRSLILLIPVLLALIGDNAVIAAGSTIGTGDTLLALSYPRYIAHGLFVPLLIMVGAGLCRAHGIRLPLAASGILTAALIAVGIRQDIINLNLQPTPYADTLRYTNTATHGAPIPAVVTIVVLIALGAVLLARTRSPWLLAGSSAMFAAAALSVFAFWLGNVGELLLLLGLYLTATRRPAPMIAPVTAA
ncbi:hypothetical protein [Actinoplanes derwentensis]|uniref:Uncharacterized protein n=1 Tax=Actinoplanes derwentensis TaxID=113562 RepID=A0A1H2BMN1_9ACTN|nr:hypothetical protein [Actinoplanes derwentensis]GID86884.1 hypothetical protein Ade03nite_58080 [Actinoplanes derwentensis]SDT59473.1 hypothetical protein SAMN04489716_4740 [Actinoplanes derwentensis]